MARELDGTEIKELVRLIQRRFDKNEFSAFFYMDVDDKVRFDDFVAAQDVWKVQLANFLQYTDRKNLSVALVAALAAKSEMDASEKGWLEKLSSALITAKEPVADNPDERQLWQEASVSRDPSVIEDFLTRFPGGRYTAMAQARADERIADCGDKRVLERFIKKYGASPRRVEAEARLAELADVDARPAANTGEAPRSTLLDTVSQLPKRGSMKAVVAALALILGGWAVFTIASSNLVCRVVETASCLLAEIDQTTDRDRLREIVAKRPEMVAAIDERLGALDAPLKEKIAKSEDREWLQKILMQAPELLNDVYKRRYELDARAPEVILAAPNNVVAAVPPVTLTGQDVLIKTLARANVRNSVGDIVVQGYLDPPDGRYRSLAENTLRLLGGKSLAGEGADLDKISYYYVLSLGLPGSADIPANRQIDQQHTLAALLKAYNNKNGTGARTLAEIVN